MSKTALVVDDSQSMRQMAAYSLQHASFVTVDAPDGRNALEIPATRAFSPVITDINRPQMDGLTLVREAGSLREHRFTPIRTLTIEAYQQRKDDQGCAAGAAGWLVKLVDPAKVMGVVQKSVR